MIFSWLRIVSLCLFWCGIECQCNNHGLSCVYNNTLGHGICTSCQHNTEGQHCDKCLPKYYRNMDVSMEDPNACIGKSTELLVGTQKVLKISKIMKPNV